MEYLAHIAEDGREQTIREHLTGTARRAAAFAAAFGAEDCGRAVGAAHDIGKYCAAFQRRIRGSAETCDHSTAGARELWKAGDVPGAMAVAGHHGGLPDLGTSADPRTLRGRLAVPPREDYGAFREETALPAAETPDFARRDLFSAAFFTRMLFSCLTDADFLDTETFMDGASAPRGAFPPVDTLYARLLANQEIKGWLEAPPDSAVNALRTEILRACLAAGAEAPGVYRLTVPTGGGKTCASLAFALAHAKAHGLRRVIYAIPFTSIIEQNAEKFRQWVGADAVIEHHANVDFGEGGPDACAPEEVRRRLACENWDAPLVVTTNVQFFESLFADRPSRCRKLHNIARSVIILDEAQALPLPYLKPCVRALRELTARYGCTVVLCTATQPALSGEFGLSARELCPRVPAVFAALRRTDVRTAGELTLDGLAEQLAGRAQALCVVNTRRTAKELFDRLPPEGRYHLSTLMTPQHRSAVLAEIRRRLTAGLPCRVAATSLIEAGVDVDFPAVWREEAGLDSILQAAGRCNRNGKCPTGRGDVAVFRLPGGLPRTLANQIQLARRVMEQYADITAPEAIEAYFAAWYRTAATLDAKDIGGLCGKMAFAETASRFRLIETETRALLIPRGAAADKIAARLRAGERSRALLREAAPYLVGIYPRHWEEIVSVGGEQVGGDLAVLTDKTLYDDQTGLSLRADGGQALFG